MSSGMALTSNLDLDIRANVRQGTQEIQGSIIRTRDITWPTLSVNWTGLEKFGLMKRFVKYSSLTMRFEKKHSKDRRGESTTYSLTPNWNLEWKNRISTTVSFSYNRKDWIQSSQEMWNQTWATSFDTKYSFEGTRGFGVPLPFLKNRKIKFKSRLTTALGLQYSSTSSYKSPPASTIAISPRASYKFSNTMTGALSMNYSRSSGGITGYIFTRMGINISMEFTF